MTWMQWPNVPNGAEFEWQPDPNAKRYYGFKLEGKAYLFGSWEKLLKFNNPYMADWVHSMSDGEWIQCQTVTK